MIKKVYITSVFAIFLSVTFLFNLHGQIEEISKGTALVKENHELILISLEEFFENMVLETNDDFILWLEENVPELKDLVKKVTDKETGRRDIDMIPGVSFDDSSILNSVARVVTQRFEDAVKSYFFDTFKKAINSDPLLGEFFPNTKKALNMNENNDFDLKHLAFVFEKDFQGILPRFIDYVERRIELSPANIRIIRIVRLLYIIYEEISQGKDPVYIFTHLDYEKILGESEASCISAGFKWLKLIASFDARALGDPKFATALGAYILFKIEMVTNQDVLAGVYGITEEALLDDDITWVRLDLIDQITTSIRKYTDTFVSIYHQFEILSSRVSNLNEESKPDDYLKLIKITFDLLLSTKTLGYDIIETEETEEIKTLTMDVAAEKVEDTFPSLDSVCEEQINFVISTIEYLFNRQYNAVLNEIGRFLAGLYEENEVYLQTIYEEKHAELTEQAASREVIHKLEELYREKKRELESNMKVKNLLKYGTFIATVATNSDDPDALDNAIHAAFPPLSPYTKKTSRWGLYVNAHVGIDFGLQVQGSFNNFFSSLDFKKAFYPNIKAPIGIELSFKGIRNIFSPIGLFVYPIDIGNLVSYYLQGIGTGDLDFGLDQAFAPGAFLFIGLLNSPFNIGFGYQWVRQGTICAPTHQHRLTATLCVDIPLFELYRSR